MGSVIRLHRDPHREVRLLLPWRLTGRLEGAERARVDTHLAACPQCRAEMQAERRLGAEIAGLPLDVETGWAAMRDRLAAETASSAREGRLGAWLAGRAVSFEGPGRGRRAAWIGAALALQAALLLVVAGAWPRPEAPAYHALGAPQASAGNVIVVFRPDATEQAMRDAFRAGGARLVGGPTASNAYVLHVPQARRAAALATLRARADVVLAQPIDTGGAP